MDPYRVPGPHADLGVGRVLDGLRDGVAVPFALGEGEQDVENDRGERQVRPRVAPGHDRLYPSRM